MALKGLRLGLAAQGSEATEGQDRVHPPEPEEEVGLQDLALGRGLVHALRPLVAGIIERPKVEESDLRA